MPKYHKVSRYELAPGDILLVSNAGVKEEIEVISVDNDESGCWVVTDDGSEGYMNYDAFWVVSE